MRRYLVDSGPLAALLQQRAAASELLTPWLAQGELVTSILAYGEVIEYVATRPDYSAHLTALRQLMRNVPPLVLGFGVMERYAHLRLRMRRPYGAGLIGDVDTLIAATALARNLTIVTTDGDFMRVPDLGVILLNRDRLTIVDQRAPSA